MKHTNKAFDEHNPKAIEGAFERYAERREHYRPPVSGRMKLVGVLLVLLVLGFASSNAHAQLPDPGMEIDPARTAVLITDPQNDFLSPQGVTWGVVGASVTANNTVENIERLMKAAKANNLPVFISPHYYYPTDHGWQFEGAPEALMHKIGMFDRKGALSLEGFEVAVVSDATAAAQVEEGDGYQSALVNFRFIANTVWSTEQAVQNINAIQ